jgi:hypothetical protein
VDGDVWHTFLYTTIPWSRRTPPPFLFSLFKKIKKKGAEPQILGQAFGIDYRPCAPNNIRNDATRRQSWVDWVKKKKKPAVDFFHFFYDPNELTALSFDIQKSPAVHPSLDWRDQRF